MSWEEAKRDEQDTRESLGIEPHNELHAALQAEAASREARIADHNVSETAHSDIRAAIETDIEDHNTNETAHADIRTAIGTAVSDHDANVTAHADIRALAGKRQVYTYFNRTTGGMHEFAKPSDVVDGDLLVVFFNPPENATYVFFAVNPDESIYETVNAGDLVTAEYMWRNGRWWQVYKDITPYA